MASPVAEMRDEIPILDLGPYLAGDRGALEGVARDLYRASTEVGFYYVKNHGVPQALIDRVFDEAHRFHALPLEKKRRLKVDHNKIGYFEVESTVTRHTELAGDAKPDLYAAFCMRRELAADDPEVLAGAPYRALNRWPADLPGFREGTVAYSIAMENLAKRMLPIFATALDVPVDFFDQAFENPLINMQLNYYPPQAVRLERQFGIAPHTDRGFITMLCQAQVPGLEIQTVDGRWVVAPVLPEHFLINTGELLRHWTNDVFLSTPHRVINLSGAERLSIPFFYKPDLPTLVECIPTCRSADRPAKYAPVTVLEFYDSFVKMNYPEVAVAQSQKYQAAAAIDAN